MSESMMSEYELYRWVITLLLGLVNFLFWGRIKRLEKDVEENKLKGTEIERSYLKRFEELNNRLNEVEKNIIREISELKYKN